MGRSDMALPAVSCFKADSTQITREMQTQMNGLNPDLKYFKNSHPIPNQPKILKEIFPKNTSGLPRYVS